MSRKKCQQSEITFGGRLCRYRVWKNLKSDELAKMLNISRPSLSAYENNQTSAPFEVIAALLRYDSDINLDWLLNGKGDPPWEKAIYKDSFYEAPEQYAAMTSTPLNEVGVENLGGLINMTIAILISKTEYSGSLAANIRSFYHSLELEKRTTKLESECDELRKRVAVLEEKLKLAIPQADSEKSAA